MRSYMQKRYAERRKEAIIYLGGECKLCGSQEDLEFDHKNPSEKEYEIAKLLLRNRDKLYPELDKCQLLCKECHDEKTLSDFNWQDAKKTHGTLSSFRYCKCDECKKAKASYMREYQKRGRSSIGLEQSALTR
jgi:hypothetical protein